MNIAECVSIWWCKCWREGHTCCKRGKYVEKQLISCHTTHSLWSMWPTESQALWTHTTVVCLTLPSSGVAELNATKPIAAAASTLLRTVSTYVFGKWFIDAASVCVCVCVCAGFDWRVCKLNWTLHCNSRQASIIQWNPSNPDTTVLLWWPYFRS